MSEFESKRPRNRATAPGLHALVLLLACLSMAVTSGGAGYYTTHDSDTARQREIAGRELDQARQNAIEARAAEQTAKTELDNFVARHFDALKSHLPSTTPPPAAPPADPELAGLEQQYRELTAQRNELLKRFTPAHPEVADAEQRLATVNERLAAIKGAVSKGEPPAPGATAPPTESTDPIATDHAAVEQRRYQEFAAEYEQVFKRWQTAQATLQAAISAEDTALTRLSSLEAVEACKPAPAQILPPGPLPLDEAQNRSQSLALAALLIALAVAALAAVRLARSDSIFSSVDDIAAALALPVVGVIPASASGAMAQAGRRPLTKLTILIAELAAAFAAFTLIAYALQNPLTFWEFCTHPLDSLRDVGGN